MVESKGISQTHQVLHAFHATLQFIINLAEGRIREEMGIEIDDQKVDRKERQIILQKQAQLVEYFKREVETCEMACEDARARANLNILKGQRLSCKFIHYLQQQEVSITDYSTKIMERALKFAKRLVLEVTQWTSFPDDHKEKNKYMWVLQMVFADIVGTLDTGDEEYINKFALADILASEVSELRVMDSIAEDPDVFTHLTRNDLPELLHLFKMLQLTELICLSTTVNRIAAPQVTYTTINESARLIGRSMAMLPHFLKPDDDKVHIFIQQCMRALQALLSTPHAINRFTKDAEDEEAAAAKGKGGGAKAFGTPKKGGTSLRGGGYGYEEEETKKEKPKVKWSWGTSKFNEKVLFKALIYWTKLAVDCRLMTNKLLPTLLEFPGYDGKPPSPRKKSRPGSPGSPPGGTGGGEEEAMLGMGMGMGMGMDHSLDLDRGSSIDAGAGLGEGGDGLGLHPSVSQLGMNDSLAESSFGHMLPHENYADMGLDGFEDDGFGEQHDMQKAIIQLMYDRIDAAGTWTIGSDTVCDLLRCCISSISAHTEAGPEVLPDLATDRSLINSTSKLALVVLQQYHLELSNARAFNFNSPQFLAKADEEAIYAIQVATVIFQANILNYTSMDILIYGLKISQWRTSNFFMGITFLQALYSALLAYGHDGLFCEDDISNRSLTKQEASREAYVAKERIPDSYKESVVRVMFREQIFNQNMVLQVMKTMGSFSSSLTIQHVGLQILRMLLRKPFCTKGEIQDLIDDGEEEGDEEPEELEGDDAAELASLATARDLDKWHNNVWDKEIKNQGEGDATTAQNLEGWTLTELIQYISDTHMQSYEICEQLLLLIQSLAMLSYLMRVTMMERGIERTLNRVIEVKANDVYMMALVHACSETLARID